MSIIGDKIARPPCMRGFLCIQPYTYLQIHTYYKFHQKKFKKNFSMGQKKLQFVSYSEIHSCTLFEQSFICYVHTQLFLLSSKACITAQVVTHVLRHALLELNSFKAHPHYATRQNATHCNFAMRQKCSAYAANAIASTWKNNFLQTFFRLQKLWNEIGELLSDFFLKLADTILKPFTHHMPRGFLWGDRQFADQIFRACSIEWHKRDKKWSLFPYFFYLILGKIMKTFQGNIEVSNYLIYEILR